MLRLLNTAFVLAAGLFLLAGCHAPPEPEGRTVARVSAPNPEDYDRIWEAASHALRKQYYVLDRQDRGEGVITTRPETSASWFEFWRPQPTPSYYWWESNIQTIQRRATVSIKPADLAGNVNIDVQVERSRYNLPERQIDNSAAAARLYSSAAPTEEGRMERASKSGYWSPVGRDEFAERRILDQIVSTYGATPFGETQPAAQ